MNGAVLAKPLTNIQLQILKNFEFQVNDEELKDFQQLLVNFFAKRAQDEFDKLWKERGWSNETMETWLNEEKQ